MKRAATLLAFAAAIACLSGCASATAARSLASEMPAEAREAPDRYVVVTVRNESEPVAMRAAGTPRGYDGVTSYSASTEAKSTARHLAADYGLTETAAWPITLLRVHCIVYALPAGLERDTVLQRLAADRRVESVQPLTTFKTQALPYNDPYANLQQSLVQMRVPDAQQWSRGAGVRLAIIDTGVDVAHPDLHGRVAAERNFVDSDEAAFKSDQHGTAVAGVITAVANNRIGIAGIAPEVTLLAYKACWKPEHATGSAVCNTFTLAQALAAAVDAKADVVNLSLAGPTDPLLTRIVQRGLGRGIVFVGAAPLEGARAGFPGSVDGVITVDAPDRRTGTPATLVAPGRDVLTLVPGAHYDFASGSSLAAAQASAVVALLLARDHRLDASQLERLLARTSHTVSTGSGTFTTIDACAALVAIQQRGTCTSAPQASTATVERVGSESAYAEH
jgi:hypothetical protein